MRLRETLSHSDAILKASIPRQARQRYSGAQTSSRLLVERRLSVYLQSSNPSRASLKGGLQACLPVRADCQTQIRQMVGHCILRRGHRIYSGTYILLDIIAPILPMRKSQPILLSRNFDSVLGPVCNPESAILHFFHSYSEAPIIHVSFWIDSLFYAQLIASLEMEICN